MRSQPVTHGLRFEDTAFVVVHRRIEYGPFDYQWSTDLSSVILTYAGQRYGEVCSPEQLQADLREFRLPRKVVQVAMLVAGCQLHSIRNGHDEQTREQLLRTVLTSFGCDRFLDSAAA
ncbi:MAG: hypothetical protein R3B90_17240 [Planctomycetaceae bacterium]